jgi:predicted acetylornithine/succinylornithine family transaminase
MTISQDKVKEYQDRYVLGTYAPAMKIVRGKGSRVWDETGRCYLDFSMGISVSNLGHCHPAVVRAIQKQAETLIHVSNLYYTEVQPQLAATIAQHSFNGRVFFCNSGAEANEGLIKFARKWGNPEGRYEIICMDHSFHGRTLATLAATGRKKYSVGFEPHMEGFLSVPYNDLEAVRQAVTPRTVAVLIEPVQGEGGIIPASKAFMQGVRKLCDEKNLLLLCDEVQCGMGRTGTWFAYQHYGIEPDGMSLAKALGNGVPLGAFEIQDKYNNVLLPGTHASTFGGNPLACAAGLAVFEAMENEKVLDNCRTMGAYLKKKFEELQTRHPCIREVRCIGLMIGLDLTLTIKDVIAAAREKQLLVLPAGESVLRLMPALNLSREEADEAVAILDQVFAGMKA